MDVIDALRSARVSRGWDQSELARRLGTSQSAISFVEGRRRSPRLDTVENWLSATNHRVVVYPSVFADATETARSIDDALTVGDRDRAWRALLDYSDGLAVCLPVECVLLAASAPPVSAEPTWAAALAAVTDWRLRDRALPVPEWVDEPERTLTNAQPLVISDYDLTPELDDVPEEFQRRNLLVEAGALRSA
ncbi:MAG: helix-turn-helix domain-containing protein [Actinobacteria bacterium]|nr:helix-turn-helix domain-containing protein [Actinomycetota bacterium]MBU1608824.1 helix-turn-helix domain-containing protein [Actinomycetota bacterium]MBU2314585.1 helix-turn-helix domain-containing protein [Actinomycetota bacterium]MBU2384220.1 helix-turn-helix domain-containing protein [Actinomycetota bacterium]